MRCLNIVCFVLWKDNNDNISDFDITNRFARLVSNLRLKKNNATFLRISGIRNIKKISLNYQKSIIAIMDATQKNNLNFNWAKFSTNQIKIEPDFSEPSSDLLYWIQLRFEASKITFWILKLNFGIIIFQSWKQTTDQTCFSWTYQPELKSQILKLWLGRT